MNRSDRDALAFRADPRVVRRIMAMRDKMAEIYQDVSDLVLMVAAQQDSGMTSAEITRITGGNKRSLLLTAEKFGCLRSNPTGMRSRGRRWYATPFYPGEC